MFRYLGREYKADNDANPVSKIISEYMTKRAGPGGDGFDLAGKLDLGISVIGCIGDIGKAVATGGAGAGAVLSGEGSCASVLLTAAQFMVDSMGLSDNDSWRFQSQLATIGSYLKELKDCQL